MYTLRVLFFNGAADFPAPLTLPVPLFYLFFVPVSLSRLPSPKRKRFEWMTPRLFCLIPYLPDLFPSPGAFFPFEVKPFFNRACDPFDAESCLPLRKRLVSEIALFLFATVSLCMAATLSEVLPFKAPRFYGSATTPFSFSRLSK